MAEEYSELIPFFEIIQNEMNTDFYTTMNILMRHKNITKRQALNLRKIYYEKDKHKSRRGGYRKIKENIKKIGNWISSINQNDFKKRIK